MSPAALICRSCARLSARSRSSRCDGVAEQRAQCAGAKARHFAQPLERLARAVDILLCSSERMRRTARLNW